MKFHPNESLSHNLIEKGFSVITSSEEETRSFAKDLVSFLPDKAILLFSGNLGAGKTTFIKGMAEGLNLDPFLVTSPTFSLLHIYNGKKQLFHFDLYRLSNEEEFNSLGFAELLLSDGIFCIEWPERLPHLVYPGKMFLVQMTHKSIEERIITIKPA